MMHSLRIFLGEDPIFVFYLPEQILRMAIGYHVNYLLLELYLAYEFLVCSFDICPAKLNQFYFVFRFAYCVK